MKMSRDLPSFGDLSYNKSMKSKFSSFLERKYLEWQLSAGERQSVQNFADWLRCSQPLVTQWLNGTTKSPSPVNVYKLATKLGPEVLDVLGIPRFETDDPLLLRIQQQWDTLSDEERTLIQNLLEKAATRQAAQRPAEA
jgi:transcriptional regulator with XRE-family HTH domain